MTGDPRPGRPAFPLRDRYTPRYLQRFSYVQDGVPVVFDEQAWPGSAPVPSLATEGASKRPAPVLVTSGAKRREKDTDEAEDDDEMKVEDPSTPAAPVTTTTNSTNNEPNSGNVIPNIISAAAINPNIVHPGMIGTNVVPNVPNVANVANVTNVANVPNVTAGNLNGGSNSDSPDEESPGIQLLSPTASPRSPAEEIIEDVAPLSARAFAPTIAPASPVHPSAMSSFEPFEIEPATRLALQRSALTHSSSSLYAPLPLVPPNFEPTQLHEQMDALRSAFERLPPAMHKYSMYQLLRSCSRSTLSAIVNELEPALRFDVLGHLPPELGSMVLQHLDIASIAAVSQVCHSWYRMADGDDKLWLVLMQRAQLHPSPQDVQLAIVERWGYRGWSTLYNRGTVPTNAFRRPVNVYKAVYRRLALIHHNWMRTDIRPRRYSIKSPDREVITCLDFSGDIIIATTEGKRHLNVYDTQTGKLLHEFSGHDGGVWALKRVDKDTIVTGSTDHSVRVWSLSKKRCTHTFRGHTATVRCLDVVMPEPGDSSRDYPVILTGSRDTTLRLWRLPSPEDEDYDSIVELADKDNPYFLAELRGHTDSVRTLCGHGDLVVSGSYDDRVRVWEISTKRCRHELLGHENKVYSVIIDPERNHCISASLDFTIKIWDLDTGAELHSLVGHSGLVGLLGLRDQTLVSGAADASLRIWNPETGEALHTLRGHDTAILCFDHDGRKIVSGSVKHLKLWDVRTGKFARDLITDVEHIWQVKFSRKRCVAALSRGQNSYLEVFDFDFDPSMREYPGEEAPVIVIEN